MTVRAGIGRSSFLDLSASWMDSKWIRTKHKIIQRKGSWVNFHPIGSMYGIFTYIWLIFMVKCRYIYHTWILWAQYSWWKKSCTTAAICYVKIPVSRLFGASLLCRFFLHPPYDLQFSVLIKTVVPFAVLRSLLTMESRIKKWYLLYS